MLTRSLKSLKSDCETSVRCRSVVYGGRCDPAIYFSSPARDHAVELIVAPTFRERSPIRYKIEDTWHDLSPPPASILPAVVAELGRLAAFTRRPFPKEGLIDLDFSGVRLRWAIRMASADSDCILALIER